MITKKIGKLMIVLGIGVLVIPIIGRLYNYYEQKKAYQQYLQATQQLNTSLEDGESIEKTTAEGNISINKGDENGLKKEADTISITRGEVIGRIKIPSIKVDLLLLEGSDKKSLSLGAGHMEGTALPGEVGNCAIAGHRNYTFGQRFNRLNEVALKDQIIIEMDEKSYFYEVSNIELVKPEDISVLIQSDDKKEVTLITCHPIYRATHRLIITGELVE